MVAELVLLPAQAVGQTLRFSHHGEEHGIEELILESAVEGFSKTVLPRGACLDVGVAVLLLWHQRCRV